MWYWYNVQRTCNRQVENFGNVNELHRRWRIHGTIPGYNKQHIYVIWKRSASVTFTALMYSKCYFWSKQRMINQLQPWLRSIQDIYAHLESSNTRSLIKTKEMGRWTINQGTITGQLASMAARIQSIVYRWGGSSISGNIKYH